MDNLEKLLRRVTPKHRAQILKALACLKDNECRPRLRPEKLSGSKNFKIHVGRYRVIFGMGGSGVELVEVRLRNEKTYREV